MPRNKLVRHAEQLAQDIGRDAGQANQHGVVAEIVVGHVVDVGSGGEQFGSGFETYANRKRTRLSRTISRHARQESSPNLERGRSVCNALLHARQRQADLPNGVEVDCGTWHSESGIIGKNSDLFKAGCWGKSPVESVEA